MTVVGMSCGSTPSVIRTFDMPRNSPIPMASSACSAGENSASSSVRALSGSEEGMPIRASVNRSAATSRTGNRFS